MIIRKRWAAAIALAVFMILPSTALGQGRVSIASPADGASLDAMDDIRVAYEIVPGPRGDHAHLYVDGREVAILRQLKGSYPLETLAPGRHELCVKIVNKGHVPIGIGQCIGVTVN